MKKLIAIALMAIMLIGCFAGCGSSKKLLVATNAEFAPFESLDEDGNIVGFDVDLIKAIAEKMGYEVQFENMEFDGVVAAVANGTTDLAISGQPSLPAVQSLLTSLTLTTAVLLRFLSLARMIHTTQVPIRLLSMHSLRVKTLVFAQVTPANFTLRVTKIGALKLSKAQM